MEELAEKAYNAWAKGYMSYPTWERLSEGTREHWVSVVKEIYPPTIKRTDVVAAVLNVYNRVRSASVIRDHFELVFLCALEAYFVEFED